MEEFDGPEPSKLTLDGLAAYVRALSPEACPAKAEKPLRLADYVADARAAAQATQFALDAHDRVAAHLMLASSRSALGLIDERYAALELARDRQLLLDADLELAAVQAAVDNGAPDSTVRIAAWLATTSRWSAPLEHDESLSLFNAERLAASMQIHDAR